MRIKVDEMIQKTIQDEVIIFQTDTVYGIGCLLGSEKGVANIYEIKKRDGKKPLAILCASLDDVKTLIDGEIDMDGLASKYWPGALTLVVPKSKAVPDYVTSGFETVGVRIPDDDIALSILKQFGPMAVTSLNISTEPAILRYQDALKFEDQVDYIVEGKDCKASSSTVYDPIKKVVLRQGDLVID